ncbi:hypothetical protein Syun_003331 [Stephania yunnanensis]|uniref:Uncharacterized protein n=1 Tax=Stephania yunnanensis TaxID=152371 RepID=A0AAP0Q1I9_9MAGN
MIGESAAAAAAAAAELYGDGSGVGVVEIESESDVEGDGELGVVSGCGDCGECRRLEGEREEVNEDLEWERVEEERMELRRELHRSLMIASDVASLVSIESYETDEAMRNVGDSFESNEAMRSLDEAMRNMEWEVAGHGSDEEDDGDYVYNEDYDLVFGQFTDGESLRRSNPPAAKSVVMNSLRWINTMGMLFVQFARMRF